MKTTKIFGILLIAVLLLQGMTACQNKAPQIVELEEYPIFLYQNSVGVQGDTVTAKYTGKDYYAQENYSKSNVSKKQTKIAGDKIDLRYDKSTKLNMYKNDIDVYETFYNDRYLRIEYNEKTGKMVRYIRYAPCEDREYASELTPTSGKEEYVAYVKKILREQAGVSVDNREMQIVTKIIKEDGLPEFVSDFVNNSSIDSDFKAEYTFVFSSTIDGIDRTDDIKIVITNVGELCSLKALANDEAYAPFENVKIDKTRINSEVENAFSKTKWKYNVTSYTVSLCCMPIDSTLWVEAKVDYYYQVEEDTISASAWYFIKVAEAK